MAKVVVRHMRSGGLCVVVEVPLVDCIPTPLSPATPEQIALEVAMHAIADVLIEAAHRDR